MSDNFRDLCDYARVRITNEEWQKLREADKDEMIAIFEQRRNIVESTRPEKILHSFVSKPSPSLKSFDELQPMQFSELSVETTHHTGRYLLCRTITKPICQTKVYTLLQDLNGHIRPLVYTSFNMSTNQQELLLPLHSILLIKEPLLCSIVKTPHCSSTVEIKVDSASDLIVLSDLDHDHPYFGHLKNLPEKWLSDANGPKRTSQELNKLGNADFVAKKYAEAVRWYTRALNSTDCLTRTSEVVKKTLSNRSAAFIRLEKFYRAAEDACKAAQIDAGNTDLDEKIYYRMGQAAYAMRQYERAAKAFEKCIEMNEKNSEALARLEAIKQRINEKSSGKYDMAKIIEESQVQRKVNLDLADFVSNKIEIVKMKDGNMSVVAKENIPRNTLIMASKAVSIISPVEAPKDKGNAIHDETVDKFFDPHETMLFCDVILKAQNDPNLLTELYKLRAGKDYDRRQIDEICSKGIVDSYRLFSIAKVNSHLFGVLADDLDFYADSNTEEPIAYRGLWLAPSFFNHSCLANVARICFSDFQMLYTST